MERITENYNWPIHKDQLILGCPALVDRSTPTCMAQETLQRRGRKILRARGPERLK